jgi:hypothetical protein
MFDTGLTLLDSVDDQVVEGTTGRCDGDIVLVVNDT